MLQKSRKITILMLAILAVYMIAVKRIFLFDQYSLNYIAIPVFWIIYIIACSFLLSKSEESMRLKGDTFLSSSIACAIYVGIYIFSIFFIEVGDNPFSHSLKGILTNIYVYILPIIAREYARFRLINNVYEKDKKFISVVVTIIFIGISIGMVDITRTDSFAKIAFSSIMPVIAENILFSYIAYNRMYKPSILYKVVTYSFWIFMPFLPKVSWFITSVVDTTIPLVLLMYVRYFKLSKDPKKDNKKAEDSNPKDMVPFVIVAITALWFALGLFPIKPVAIATGSMKSAINVGDVVILKKCDANDIEVGDVIQYSRDDFTVVHRVVSKYYEDGKLLFITKGDNNKAEDYYPVTCDQIMAKELFSIRYIGYPSFWFGKLINRNQTEVTVETGS